MRASVAKQRADVIDMTVAEKDVLGGDGVVEARGGTQVEDYARTRLRLMRLAVQDRVPPR